MGMSFKPLINPNSNGWNIISKENERRVLKLQAIYMKEIVQILLPVVEKKYITNIPTNMKQQCVNFEAQVYGSVKQIWVELKDLWARKKQQQQQQKIVRKIKKEEKTAYKNTMINKM